MSETGASTKGGVVSTAAPRGVLIYSLFRAELPATGLIGRLTWHPFSFLSRWCRRGEVRVSQRPRSFYRGRGGL